MLACAVAGVLAVRDLMSGQLVMAALWQASLALAATSTDTQQAKACLTGALMEAFSRGPKHVSFVACLQCFALADRGFAVPARHAADAAVAAGRLQAGALQASRDAHGPRICRKWLLAADCWEPKPAMSCTCGNRALSCLASTAYLHIMSRRLFRHLTVHACWA